jgi:hypothetical protein
MRLMDPAAPAPASSPAPADQVRRSADPAAEQRLPSPAPAVPAGASGTAPAGTVPDSTTPAGVPGPVVTRMTAVPADNPAPEPEPPAPHDEAVAGETPSVPEQVQQYLDDSRGKGSVLPESVRTTFENAFRRPLDDVRIHDEGAADTAARSIDAVAFTIGSDIYFRSGAYNPSNSDGKRLLAHELAHVVQQRPGINRKPAGLGGAVIRRKGKKTTTPAVPEDQKGPKWTAPPSVNPQGEIDTANEKLKLAEIGFPAWKAKIVGTEFTRRPSEDDKTKQAGKKKAFETWESGVLSDVLKPVHDRLTEINDGKADAPFYLAKSGTQKEWDYYAGPVEVIAKRVARPLWNKIDFTYGHYDADHQRDTQLGGKDDISNLWLFNSKKNQAAGSKMNTAMRTAIGDFLTNAKPYLKPSPSLKTVLGWPKITFAKAVPADSDEAIPTDFWEKKDMGTADHMKGLKPLDKKERDAISGTAKELQIFDRPYGGRKKPLKLDSSGTVPADGFGRKIKKGISFKVTKVEFNAPGPEGTAAKVGSLTGTAFEGSDELEAAGFTVDLMGLPGLQYAAYTTKAALVTKFNGLSPVMFSSLEFDVMDGFVGRAGILPENSLLKGVEVALVLEGGNIGIEAVISGGDLGLPGPFQVTGGSLILSAGTGGLAVAGRVNFEIEKLATGFLAAGAKSKAGQPAFELEGGLDFDTEMFTKAHLGLSYREGKWGVSGELAVGPDHINGIKSASAKVAVDDGTVTAAGEFETSLKGIEKGTLGFVYDPAKGMAISGEILIGKGIPGVKGGKLNAVVAQSPAGGWSLAGAVTAEPDIPGLTGTVGGTYADGAFGVEANLAYERGQAKGSLNLGLTNRTLDQAGLPTGPVAKDGSLTAYGGGTVTLAITPWLQGTVGLKLTPTGEVEVSGKVELPKQFTVFDEKKVERKILSIGLDLPIIGVAVAGQRIGIFATIKGGVSVEAGFGPGQLRDVALEVTYNPNRPDDTTVKGAGSFVVPAHAGMRVQVDGGLGVGIPVVSATAGVSIFGEVGLAGEASAAAALSWTPRTGVVLDARGEIFVEPKFRFGIDAFVDVTADLWITEIELYHHTWKLAAFEYGSNLRFGLAFPLHYESGKPFDLSFDQIQWTYPQIDPADVLGGLMKQLVG